MTDYTSVAEVTLQADTEVTQKIDCSDRRGFVCLTAKEVATTHPAELADVFSDIGFFPYYIEYHTRSDVYSYFGRCESFDLVPEGALIPRYDVNLDTMEIELWRGG